jgi:hypothetical protein
MKETPNPRSIATIAAIVFFVATGVLFGILSMQLRLNQGDLAKPPHLLLQFAFMLFFFCFSIPNARSKLFAKSGIAYLVFCVFIGGFGVLGLYWELSDTAPPSLNDGLPMAIANTFIGIAAITLLSRGKNAFAGGLCPRICAVSILLYAGMTSWVIHHDRLLNARSEWLYWPSEIFLTMLAGLGIYTLIKGTKAYEKWMPHHKKDDARC